jgi:hypothetical protein
LVACRKLKILRNASKFYILSVNVIIFPILEDLARKPFLMFLENTCMLLLLQVSRIQISDIVNIRTIRSLSLFQINNCIVPISEVTKRFWCG